MGKKIFISYKYGDTKVKALNYGLLHITKVRDYIDLIQELLDHEDHINKGEKDGEDLSSFKDSTIESKLRNKIHDSSVTLTIISKGMKDSFLSESDQWIPWELSYSLKEHKRDGKTSQTNAILAVVLPDENDNYDYYIVEDSCPHCKCRTLKTNFLFEIQRNNMFNIKLPEFEECSNHSSSDLVYLGDSSYIHSVKWSEFKENINFYINKAIEINKNIENYEIVKRVKTSYSTIL